ncbi:MAG: CehA/McbA family metallohydrolase [Planctomyces sp.]|nr:CehA/McbA family metallohydrolase [Planctomyces sp.]
MMLLRILSLLLLIASSTVTRADESWPMAARVERQPLLAQLQRLRDTLNHIGMPLPKETETQLMQLVDNADEDSLTARVQELLDPHCLAAVSLRKDAAPVVVRREAKAELIEQGWQRFLIKVLNEPEVRVRLRIDSPNAKPLPHSPEEDVASRWLSLSMFDGQPMTPTLTGLPLEYRIVEVYSRDAGEQTARIEFAAPQPGAASVNRTSSIIADWRFEKDTAGWESMNQTTLKAHEGSLQVEGTGEDPFFGTNFAKSAQPGNLVLRFWARAEEAGVGQMFWWSEERPQPDAGHVIAFNVEPGREMLYEIPFTDDGHVNGIRIDPNGKPCSWRIDWIELAYANGGSDWGGSSFSFTTQPSTEVTFRVVDDADRPAMGCFEITDAAGRVYPPQTKRLAPDFFFQRQIYRADGETVRLPAGKYSVVCSRGPEAVPETHNLVVKDQPVTLEYRVKRWIDPSRRGYWSGDHHIHAAGCAHYESPTQGVAPPDMLRHCMGEDLKVGCCLTWGPCFDFQKRFFTGELDANSKYPYLIRYDVEVSGFGSHASGHLNLLRLQEQIPPGGDSKEHWPTLGLNTLRWAKRQGAVCGSAHSASGLTRFIDRVPNTDGLDGPNGLPTYSIPAFDGIGANEFIMNAAHTVPGPDDTPVPAVDFIATMNSDRTAEFNMWYHILNCGFRVRASGETDFPCMSGERVGLGRVYVRLDGKLDFDSWCDALAAGRSYVSDGRSHLMEFAASSVTTKQTVEAGTNNSELKLSAPGTVKFQVKVAGLYNDKRTLPVELIINGFPVASQEINSDGVEQTVTFEHIIEKSSWAAIRIFPNAHTNPVFVIVGEKPVRASRLSAEWCLKSIEQCWKAKAHTYRADERPTAEADYETAKDMFRSIVEESR